MPADAHMVVKRTSGERMSCEPVRPSHPSAVLPLVGDLIETDAPPHLDVPD